MRPRCFLLLLTTLPMLLGCATRSYTAEVYADTLQVPPVRTQRTTVVILVDGLSEQALASELTALPNIRRYFDADRVRYRAHTGFPSLTFPGIASLLKEQPMDQTGFIGNLLELNGEHLSFEAPLERERFSELMNGGTVFSRLRAQGANSVSFDYGLGADATVATPIADLTTALELSQSNYLYADTKKIEALRLLLSSSPLEHWPEFIFLHLVGVDFLSHTFGPHSRQALDYLGELDHALGPLFADLCAAEDEHAIVTLLTADHGFADHAHLYFPLEEFLAEFSNHITILNESRMAAIYLKPGADRKIIVAKLLHEAGIENVAEKTTGGFRLRSRALPIDVQIRASTACTTDHYTASVNQGAWRCLSETDRDGGSSGHPFLISNLAHYFLAENSPELSVIPDAQTVFSTTDIGNHGGVTTEEVIVPLLIRNGKIRSDEVIPLWRLLRFVQ